MAGERQKTAVELAFLTAQDRVHYGLGVIVNHPDRHALEESEGAVVGVEHHLLRFAGIGAKVRLAAVREAKVRSYSQMLCMAA